MGFESFNALLNLGGIFVLVLGFFVQLILVFALSKVTRWAKSKETKLKWIMTKADKFLNWRKEQLIFSHLIIIVFESVFHLTIAGLLGVLRFKLWPEDALEVSSVTEAFTQIAFGSSIMLLFCLLFL